MRKLLVFITILTISNAADDLLDTETTIAENGNNDLDDLKTLISEHKRLITHLQSKVSMVAQQNQLSHDHSDILHGHLSDHDGVIHNMKVLKNIEHGNFYQQIKVLENKIEALEKFERLRSIEILGVPIEQDEDEISLISIVRNITEAVGLEPMEELEIQDIYRTNDLTIIVDFTTTLRKDELLAETEKNDINFDKNESPIYVQEYLTALTRHLFNKAREMVDSKELTEAWTSKGNVYVKRFEEGKPILINEEQDLQQIIF